MKHNLSLILYNFPLIKCSRFGIRNKHHYFESCKMEGLLKQYSCYCLKLVMKLDYLFNLTLILLFFVLLFFSIKLLEFEQAINSNFGKDYILIYIVRTIDCYSKYSNKEHMFIGLYIDSQSF